MVAIFNKKSLETWTRDLLSQGRYGFALDEARKAFSSQKSVAIKSALKRLVDKEYIVSIHKGYYLIITPQYQSKGILPPSLFLDSFMQVLNKPYYLGLLSAASYHGSSHQQPQEFFVVTSFPVLRPMQKKGIKINFISKREIPSKLLENKKTEAGYLKISNAVFTATDLIQYAKRIGGINRVAAVLAELVENIQTSAFDNDLLENVSVAALQRLGYLLDKVLNNQELATALMTLLDNNCTPLFRIPLKAAGETKGFETDERWKVIINTIIEIDE